MKYFKLLLVICGVVIILGCTAGKKEQSARTFNDDLEFLKKHTDVIVLSDVTQNQQVLVLPKLQGRVMTSTADGLNGVSYGWVNRELIASGKIQEHINVFGGEDRFWIGPEGGQYSIFFKNGVPFDLEHWFTPAPLDTEPFELVAQSNNQVTLKKELKLDNYSGTVFNLLVEREVRLINSADQVSLLGVSTPQNVKVVAFETVNKMTNTGSEAWQKETGLLSIWILGMFNPSPKTTVVVPFTSGPETDLGKIVNDNYFGKVPAERLVVKENVLYFSGDGQYRSKIGLTPQRAKAVLGSYDAENRSLTIVQYNQPEDALDYVNSMWELQEAPYKGDVVNSYNDGPAEPGAKPLGPFYELETSSQAAALQPGEAITHIHRTFHFQGSEAELTEIAQKTLGVTIADIKAALAK
ncbi:MAG: DUF6786 family protein [Methanosarcinaceae archaeon]